jgi:serine/threonine-protein kinase
MASVYLGRLLGRVGFRRTVAVKRLHAHLALDPDFRAMFLDEARLAARIRHPNVVPTLDIVSTNDELFLVMEYIDGESLSALVRRLGQQNLRIPLPIISAIVCDTLAGLHAAHEAKGDHGEPLSIVHRDVSPQNVLVGADGVSRVLDFGVAKAIGNSVQTRDGQIKGKLAYMSPEQIRDGPLTRSADIYAAGVVLWEMTMGRRLWAAESEAALVAKMVSGDAPPAYTGPAGGSYQLDEVIMRGLARDPQERFATARDMARALERVMPPATHQTVADWFAEVAAEGVAKRRDVLSRIESMSSRIIVSSQPPLADPNMDPPPPAGPQDIVPTPRPPSGRHLHYQTPSFEVDLSTLTPSGVSSLSSLSTTGMPTTATSPTVLRHKRAIWPYVAAGAGCTVLMTIGLLLIIHVLFPSRVRRASAAVERPPTASVTAVATAPVPPVAATPTSTASVTAAETSASPSASSDAPTPTSSAPKTPPTVTAAPRPTVAATATATATATAPKPTATSASRPPGPASSKGGPSLYSRD